MKITEQVSRECCQTRDLRPIEGTPLRGRDPAYVFCVHCGAQHVYDTYMDAAGSRDWRYTKIPAPWELFGAPKTSKL